MKISQENKKKLYELAYDVEDITGQEPQDEHDLLRLIEDYHVDISQLVFPEGSYDAFREAVGKGFYDARVLQNELETDFVQRNQPVLSDEELIDGIVNGTISFMAPPTHSIWKKVEERRQMLREEKKNEID